MIEAAIGGLWLFAIGIITGLILLIRWAEKDGRTG